MPRVPVLGRLYFPEYVALVFSFLFLMFESALRLVTLLLPVPVINFFYKKSRSAFNSLSPKRYTTVESSRREKDIVEKVRDADGFIELVELWNSGQWRVEEHVVQTKDGYLLCLHRIVKKGRDRSRSKNRKETKINGNGGKKVVYLHHGLLMNSEVWVSVLDKERCLPFALAEKGYDVWLGNNRGNKYSKKSIHHPSNSKEFWNFSMDEFAFHDIPDSINYVLNTTKQESLSYIGFSQGTAQAFATLSIHPALNEKVDVFIALAPAMSPAGLSNAVVDALTRASPNMMYLFFGRKSILSSTTFWQSVLYPPIFVRIIDVSNRFLFKWTGNNISLNQKIAAYAHLYSFTSVKSVVHWFQIIRNKSFQMYDDDIQSSLTTTLTGRSFYKVAKFPTRNITTPITLVYGGCDSLVDIDVMLKELPGHTVAKEIPHYEHVDMLWADGVESLVFPHVFEALDKYSVSSSEQAEERSNPPSTSKDESTRHVESLSTYSDYDLPGPKHTNIQRSPPRIPLVRNIFSSPPGGLSRSSSPLTFQAKLEAQEPIPTHIVNPPKPPLTPPASILAEGAGSPAQTSPLPDFMRGKPHRSDSISSTGSTSSRSGMGSIGPSGISIGSARPVSAVSKGDENPSDERKGGWRRRF